MSVSTALPFGTATRPKTEAKQKGARFNPSACLPRPNRFREGQAHTHTALAFCTPRTRGAEPRAAERAAAARAHSQLRPTSQGRRRQCGGVCVRGQAPARRSQALPARPRSLRKNALGGSFSAQTSHWSFLSTRKNKQGKCRK